MINFIIIEDDLSYIHKYKTIIDKIMIQYDIDYEIIILDKYNSKNQKFIEKDSFKIYIIDYKKENNSLEMIKYIREIKNDWQSLLIITYSQTIPKFKDNYFLVDSILKQSDIDSVLMRDIQICLKNYDQRPNTLKYCYKKIIYNIEYQRIIYIEKEQDNKRCIIKTIEKEYYIQGCLKKVEDKLDKRFMKCNRSYIINLEQIESYDPKTNCLTFKDQSQLNTISRNKKKELINYIRGINR